MSTSPIELTAVRGDYMSDVAEEQAHSSVPLNFNFYSHVLCDKNLQDSEKLSGYRE